MRTRPSFSITSTRIRKINTRERGPGESGAKRRARSTKRKKFNTHTHTHTDTDTHTCIDVYMYLCVCVYIDIDIDIDRHYWTEHMSGRLALESVRTGLFANWLLGFIDPTSPLLIRLPQSGYIAKSRPARFEYTPTGLGGLPPPFHSPIPISGWPSAIWTCCCCDCGNAPAPGDCE